MISAHVDPVPSKGKALSEKGSQGVFSFMVHIGLFNQFQAISHLLDSKAQLNVFALIRVDKAASSLKNSPGHAHIVTTGLVLCGIFQLSPYASGRPKRGHTEINRLLENGKVLSSCIRPSMGIQLPLL